MSEVKELVKVITPEVMMAEDDFSSLPLPERHMAEVRLRIRNAGKAVKDAFFSLSRDLLEVNESGKLSGDRKAYYESWGYKNFEEYVEGELDMSSRIAYELVSVAKMVRTYKLDQERVQAIGWTKAAAIARAGEQATRKLDENDMSVEEISQKKEEIKGRIEELLDLAQEVTVPALQDKLKEETKKIDPKDATQQKHKISWLLEGVESTTFESALEVGKSNWPHLKTDKEITAAILGDWMELREAMPEGVTLDAAIARLEKTYGVKLMQSSSAPTAEALMGGFESPKADDLTQSLMADVDLNQVLGKVQ